MNTDPRGHAPIPLSPSDLWPDRSGHLRELAGRRIKAAFVPTQSNVHHREHSGHGVLNKNSLSLPSVFPVSSVVKIP